MSERADTRRRMALPLGAAAICIVGLIICAFIDPRIAAAGWLVGFSFWSGIAIGSLLLLMIRRLTGGRWGDVIRPDLERSAATIPLLVVLIIPLFVAIPTLFPWAQGAAGIKPDVLHAYLNMPLFIVRSLIAIAGWSVLAILLARLAGRRGQLVAAVGLVFHCLIIGPIGFDWVLSLAPPFGSSSFGASVAIIQLIAALAWTVMRAPPPAHDEVAGDLGGLLLAFLLGITYVDFMAVLVIWYGDVPTTSGWFVAREPWRALAIAAFVLVALVPILALMLTRARRDASGLRAVGACVLIGLFCYDAYLIVPPFGFLALIPAALATLAIGLLFVVLTAAVVPFWRTRARPAYGD
jgi:hypothetical protein